jgi:hypothetical protein
MFTNNIICLQLHFTLTFKYVSKQHTRGKKQKILRDPKFSLSNAAEMALKLF